VGFEKISQFRSRRSGFWPLQAREPGRNSSSGYVLWIRNFSSGKRKPVVVNYIFDYYLILMQQQDIVKGMVQ
jgi:hypothetical protein